MRGLCGAYSGLAAMVQQPPERLGERELVRLPILSRRLHAVAFSRDGRFLATGSADNTVRLWSLSND